MTIPRILQDTINGLLYDLKGNDTSLNPSELGKKLNSTNPKLANAIISLSGGSIHAAENMLYICELIERQMESDKLSDEYD